MPVLKLRVDCVGPWYAVSANGMVGLWACGLAYPGALFQHMERSAISLGVATTPALEQVAYIISWLY